MRTLKSNIIIWLAICSLAIISCNKKQDSNKATIVFDETPTNNNTKQKDTKPSTTSTPTVNKNSLNSLAKEVSKGLNDIKNLEKLLSTTNLDENPEKKAQYRNDLTTLSNAVQDRMKRLAQIEVSINENKDNKLSENDKKEILGTIDSLKKQLIEQQDIANKINNKIGVEKTSKTEKNNDSIPVSNFNEEKQAIDEVEQQAPETNECYFAIGTHENLKKHKIIESSFLQKTTVMQTSSIMYSYFTKADRRTLNEINLHSKNAKVITTHDKQSFSLEDSGGSKVLRIYDQDLFWKNTNYLVVQIE